MLALSLLYFLSVALLCVLGAHRTFLMWSLVRRPYRSPSIELASEKEGMTSRVCVQIPLFNEPAVAERIIRAVSRIRYPRDYFEIQILDDSTDHTSEVVDALVRELSAAGEPIRCIRRSNREGFKAGALAEGMRQSRAEFFAVFDADFVPAADFLEATLPCFQTEKTGFVQTRWDHINRGQNLFTRAQALLIDAHFLVEHAGRYSAGLCFNFNGTAGVWRRQAIDIAGGWQGDTITEDLDLSYRVQMSGWQGVYMRDYTCPSELPATITAFKSQQFRWTRGSAQVLRKLAVPLFKSGLDSRQKREAFFHLTAHLGYVFALILACLLVPVSAWRAGLYQAVGSPLELALFAFMLTSFGGFFWFGQRQIGRAVQPLELISAIALGVGITLHCAIASVVGLLGGTGVFVRTPKTGSAADMSKLIQEENSKFHVPGSCFFPAVGRHKKEFCMVLYLGAGMVYLAMKSQIFTLPFVLLLLAGYVMILFVATEYECSVDNV